MLCWCFMCSSKLVLLLSKHARSNPGKNTRTNPTAKAYYRQHKCGRFSLTIGFGDGRQTLMETLPQIKQVLRRISSFCVFSDLRSAKVSMMTPKMRLSTMMMTMKKKSRSYKIRNRKRGSYKTTVSGYRPMQTDR